MLLTITNDPRDYAWGSTSLLADLEGRAPSGAPEAEVWFGDHSGDPADVSGGGTLDAVTGGSLPYLLKLLAAADPLSIQVHPTREQAQQGFAREAGMAAVPAQAAACRGRAVYAGAPQARAGAAGLRPRGRDGGRRPDAQLPRRQSQAGADRRTQRALRSAGRAAAGAGHAATAGVV